MPKRRVLTYAEAQKKNVRLKSLFKYGVAEVHATLKRAKSRKAHFKLMGSDTFISESRNRTDWFAVWVR